MKFYKDLMVKKKLYMKKSLVIASFICLSLAVIGQLDKLLTVSYSSSFNFDRNKTGIDSTKFKDLDTGKLVELDMALDKPTILMYLDPTCDDCITMVEQILSHFEEFEKCKLIMITEADISQVTMFYDNYHLETYVNLKIVLDVNQVMYTTYGLVEYPSFVIFNAKQEQIITLDEFVTFPILVKYVRQAVAENSKANF